MPRCYTVSKPHPCACGCGLTAWGARKYAEGCAWRKANGPRIRAAIMDRDKLALDLSAGPPAPQKRLPARPFDEVP